MRSMLAATSARLWICEAGTKPDAAEGETDAVDLSDTEEDSVVSSVDALRMKSRVFISSEHGVFLDII